MRIVRALVRVLAFFTFREVSFEKKIQTLVIDGDDVRSGLCQDLGFSIDDRKENVRRVSEMAKLMARNGFVVIVSLISLTQKIRLCKKIIGKEDFFEIFIKSSFEKCKQRDVKCFTQN